VSLPCGYPSQPLCFALLMAGAFVSHLRHWEYPMVIYNAVIIALALFVARTPGRERWDAEGSWSALSPQLVSLHTTRFDVSNASLQVSEIQPTASTRVNVREASRFNV
jgi:hypothetical protein